MSQGSNDFTLYRNSVFIDFLVEGLAQSNGVLKAFDCKLLLPVIAEPEPYPIKEVKPHRVNQSVLVRLIIGPEENRGSEHALKALHDSPVMTTVLGETEEIQHLSCTVEVNDTTPLLHGKGGDPDGDETILTKGQAKSRMTRDIEEELAVAAGVVELIVRRSAKWNAA